MAALRGSFGFIYNWRAEHNIYGFTQHAGLFSRKSMILILNRDGHRSETNRTRLYFSDPDLNFWEKTGSGLSMYGMMYIECMQKHGRDRHRAGSGD